MQSYIEGRYPHRDYLPFIGSFPQNQYPPQQGIAHAPQFNVHRNIQNFRGEEMSNHPPLPQISQSPTRNFISPQRNEEGIYYNYIQKPRKMKTEHTNQQADSFTVENIVTTPQREKIYVRENNFSLDQNRWKDEYNYSKKYDHHLLYPDANSVALSIPIKKKGRYNDQMYTEQTYLKRQDTDYSDYNYIRNKEEDQSITKKNIQRYLFGQEGKNYENESPEKRRNRSHNYRRSKNNARGGQMMDKQQNIQMRQIGDSFKDDQSQSNSLENAINERKTARHKKLQNIPSYDSPFKSIQMQLEQPAETQRINAETINEQFYIQAIQLDELEKKNKAKIMYEYQKQLQEQIEEDKKRKRIEKSRREEEEMKFEIQYQKQLKQKKQVFHIEDEKQIKSGNYIPFFEMSQIEYYDQILKSPQTPPKNKGTRERKNKYLTREKRLPSQQNRTTINSQKTQEISPSQSIQNQKLNSLQQSLVENKQEEQKDIQEEIQLQIKYQENTLKKEQALSSSVNKEEQEDIKEQSQSQKEKIQNVLEANQVSPSSNANKSSINQKEGDNNSILPAIKDIDSTIKENQHIQPNNANISHQKQTNFNQESHVLAQVQIEQSAEKPICQQKQENEQQNQTNNKELNKESDKNENNNPVAEKQLTENIEEQKVDNNQLQKEEANMINTNEGQLNVQEQDNQIHNQSIEDQKQLLPPLVPDLKLNDNHKQQILLTEVQLHPQEENQGSRKASPYKTIRTSISVHEQKSYKSISVDKTKVPIVSRYDHQKGMSLQRDSEKQSQQQFSQQLQHQQQQYSYQQQMEYKQSRKLNSNQELLSPSYSYKKGILANLKHRMNKIGKNQLRIEESLNSMKRQVELNQIESINQFDLIQQSIQQLTNLATFN